MFLLKMHENKGFWLKKPPKTKLFAMKVSVLAWATEHARRFSLALPECSCSTLDFHKTHGNSCISPPGDAKHFVSSILLKGSAAGSLRNTGSSVGISNSLRNHCQQQLVALFTPALHPGRWQGIHGNRAEPCGMDG